MIFDTHAHYDDEAFEPDREELLRGMPEAGIPVVVNIGASMRGCHDTMALIDQYENVYGAVGIHPDHACELTEEGLEELKKMAAHDKILAIGEIGLDYYWDKSEHEVQKVWFGRQMELARELGLPIIVHSREAAQDTYDTMKAYHAEEIGGVVHCFSYGPEMAELFLKMGFYIGIGGVVTFKNAKKVKEVVEKMPLDRLVLETDCPYLAPVPYRGKRNSSLLLTHVVEEIAKIRGISEEEVERITFENATKLYSKYKGER